VSAATDLCRDWCVDLGRWLYPRSGRLNPQATLADALALYDLKELWGRAHHEDRMNASSSQGAAR
jgi:hypothetical protein